MGPRQQPAQIHATLAYDSDNFGCRFLNTTGCTRVTIKDLWKVLSQTHPGASSR